MDSLRYLKGLVSNAPIQQIAISPSEPLLNFLERDPQILVYHNHEHDQLYQKLFKMDNINQYKALVLDGADGQCLHVVGIIAMWLYRYNLGEKIPKLILIGESDFKLPEYATFVRYPYQERSHDVHIITDTVNSWHTIISESVKNLSDKGLIVLVVPREKDFIEFSRICSNLLPSDVKILTWPSKPSSNSKELIIVQGEIDSREWYPNVEIIIDLGLESNMVLSSMGGEEEVVVISDQHRINRRELWLGYSRPGVHYRLFEPSSIPKQNKLPVERRRLYSLINHLRNLTPNYHELIPLIPNNRIKSTEKVLDHFNIDNFFIENLNYSPFAIKLIQNQWKKENNNSSRIISAILISCIIENPEKLIIRENIKRYYQPKYVSPLLNHFKMAKKYFISGEMPDFCNQRHFQELKMCMEGTIKLLGIDNIDYSQLEIDHELKDDLIEIFNQKIMKYVEGKTYEDKNNRKWLVDTTMSSLPDHPNIITAVGWKIVRGKSIVYLWI